MRSKNTFATIASVVVTAALAGLADAAVIPLDLATNNSGSINLAGGDNTFDFEISGVQYLIVAGGGAGGSSYFSRGGGGGGAGGFLSGASLLLPEDSYTVNVGAGGVGQTGARNGTAPKGGDSYLRNSGLTIDFTAVGGGGGGNSTGPGGSGGSGGGGGSQNPSLGGSGTALQGSAGGDGNNSGDDSGGGGGGAGGPGGDAGSGVAGVGGPGLTSSIINGTPVTYAVGGTGSVQNQNAPSTIDEADNTGNGGQSRKIANTNSGRGGNGGSGIVVVRYDSYNDQQVFTGGTTIGQVGGDWVHQFTATGSSSLDFASDLDAVIAANISGSGDLRWDNTGILTLTGDNTYSGDTIVDTGTLELADGGELLFYIGADDVNNWINDNEDVDAETLLVNGDFVFNLSSASTTAGDSWNIVDVAALTETFGGTFGVRSTLGDFIENAGVWTKSENGITYEFDESTGVLTAVIPEPASLALLGLGGLLLCGRRR